MPLSVDFSALDLSLEDRIQSPVRRTIAKSNSSSRTSSPASSEVSDKLKPSTFSISALQIGKFAIDSEFKGDIVGKFYYSRKQLIWEFLDQGLKKKIEIPFKSICAIDLQDAPSGDSKEAMLIIDVSHSPRFYVEVNPQPKKNTMWSISPDFTEGEALNCARHSIVSRRALLKRYCEKLKQIDPRFEQLFEAGVSKEPLHKIIPAHNLSNSFSLSQDSEEGVPANSLHVDLNLAVLRTAQFSGIDFDQFGEFQPGTPNSLSAGNNSDADSSISDQLRSFDDLLALDQFTSDSILNETIPTNILSPLPPDLDGSLSVNQASDALNFSLNLLSLSPAKNNIVEKPSNPTPSSSERKSLAASLRSKNPSFRRVFEDAQLDNFSFSSQNSSSGYHSS
jgi:hypothetical protein